MPIPTYDALMLPVLRLCAERLWTMRELIAHVADDLRLTDEERAQMVPSGGATLIASRVHWAKTYLKQAGLVEQPKRAEVRISERGLELAANPARIDQDLLQQYEDFGRFLDRKHITAEPAVTKPTSNESVEVTARLLLSRVRRPPAPQTTRLRRPTERSRPRSAAHGALRRRCAHRAHDRHQAHRPGLLRGRRPRSRAGRVPRPSQFCPAPRRPPGRIIRFLRAGEAQVPLVFEDSIIANAWKIGGGW